MIPRPLDQHVVEDEDADLRARLGGGLRSDRDTEGRMLHTTTAEPLADQLLRVARDPDLRQLVYEQLGEYCHQCRNRLNSLKLSLYLAMRYAPAESTPLWDEADRHYRDLERRVERVQALCRPLALSRVTLGLDLLVDDRAAAWTRAMESAGRTLAIVPPVDRAVASFDVDRLGQALDSLVDWRSTRRSTRSGPARLRWWVASGRAHIAWEEDGASPPATPPTATGEGPTWTLPLMARVAEAHGGEIRVEDDRGWRIELSWPCQTPSP